MTITYNSLYTNTWCAYKRWGQRTRGETSIFWGANGDRDYIRLIHSLNHAYSKTLLLLQGEVMTTVCIHRSIYIMYVCMIITYIQSMDQPDKVANPARRQLNRENEYFLVPVRASHNHVTIWHVGTWVRSRQTKIFSLLCVCVFSSHPFWTSSSLDVPAGVTQEEGHTGFLIHLPSAVRALIFVARRIQPFLSLVDREVEFCVLTN